LLDGAMRWQAFDFAVLEWRRFSGGDSVAMFLVTGVWTGSEALP